MGDPERKMSAHLLAPAVIAPGPMPSGVGAPIPPRVYCANQVADELTAETNLLESRRTLYAELRQAEANEQTTTEKRIADEHTTACRLAEEADQGRRAHEADAIAARAAEEHRIRAAEARACCDRAEAANAALKHAQAAREAEVKAAETTANEARNSEANFSQARSIEGRALAERTGVEQNLHNLDNQFHTHVSAGYGQAPAAYGYPAGY